MHKFMVVASVLLAWSWAVTPANAVELYVGNETSIQFEPPEGLCFADPNGTEYEKAWVSLMHENLKQANNNLRGLFADCTSLNLLKSGTKPDMSQWLQVTTLMKHGVDEPTLTGYTRAKFLQTIEEATKALGNTTPDVAAVNTNLAQILKERLGASSTAAITLSEPKNLGLLAVDDNATYLGLLMRVASTEGGSAAKEKGYLVAAVSTSTLLKQQMLAITNYKKYEGPQTIETLLTQSKEMASRTVALNDTPTAAQVETPQNAEFDWRGKLSNASGGGVNGALIAFLFAAAIIILVIVGASSSRRK